MGTCPYTASSCGGWVCSQKFRARPTGSNSHFIIGPNPLSRGPLCGKTTPGLPDLNFESRPVHFQLKIPVNSMMIPPKKKKLQIILIFFMSVHSLFALTGVVTNIY